MRRLAALIALAVVGVAAVVLLAGRGSGGAGTYRVDAIFDHSRGLVPGQLVEVAGARVGTITAVKLTRAYQARVQMRVDSAFAPFKRDATCTIRAQGLLAENFVQCDPGSAGSGPLRGGPRGGAPTVPLARTTIPVSLSDLFDIWSAPTSQRMGVLLSELGIASAARGSDLNAILRRANPALGHARGVIALLQRQRADLTRAIDATDVSAAALAPHAGDVGRLVRHAAGVLARTQARAGDLERAVAGLPRMLEAAQPALAALGTVTHNGTPLLGELHRSAASVNALTATAVPLARAAAPSLRALAPVLRRGAAVVRRAAPLTKVLAGYAQKSLPSAQLAGRLLTNLRDTGFTSNLLRFFYDAAAASARFDDVSHILPAHISVTPCALYATTPVAGCRATYTDVEAHPRRRRARREAPRPATASAPQPQAPAAAAGPAPPAPTTTPVPPPPPPLAPAGDAVKRLLDYLLK